MEKPNGLYRKYKIERTDGTLINPENEYFILKVKGVGDQKHIDASRKAVITYAEEMRRELPELANDLFIRYREQLDNRQRCYKTGAECKYKCSGLCKDNC